MRKLSRPQMPGVPPNVASIFNQIFDASNENDTIDIASAFTITGSFTATRNLNVTSPTLANAVAVLATLITDLQRGGTNRTT